MTSAVGPGVSEVVTTVSQHLRTREAITGEAPRAASVAIVLFEVDSIAHYCLIKRAKRGRNAGQWALPGGKIDTGETARDAALREAEEEVSLSSSRAEVIGRLDDVVTTSGFVMSPFILAAPKGWRPVAAAKEVAGAFEFNVADLLAPDVALWAAVDEGPRILQMRIADGVRIHAPTGAVLWQFSQTALQGREVSVAGLRQPDFTRR